MNWREAFFRQASSDHLIRQRLNTPAVEYCHRLHYLQMMTEKLAKAFLTGPDDQEPPQFSHVMFVRLLRVIRGRPDMRRVLGYSDSAAFRQFIDSLLPLADQIQRLAPSVAGTTQPNPEYPWKPAADQDVIAPADYAFPLFDPRAPRMIKLETLLDRLVNFAV
jgi:hypothetical protein